MRLIAADRELVEAWAAKYGCTMTAAAIELIRAGDVAMRQMRRELGQGA